MRGRRIPDGSPIEDVSEPGDYLLLPDRHAIWCMLPNGVISRIPVSEKGPTDRPARWGMVEHEDGTITLRPSINLLPIEGSYTGWHGFLERSVWRQA